MGGITPGDVNRARARVVWAVRAGAFVLLSWGAYLVLKRTAFIIVQGGSLLSWLRAFDGVGYDDPISRGVGMLIVGGTLALTSRRVARWVVAMPDTGCPRCGYSGPVNDTCPECGQVGVGEDHRADGPD